MLVKPTVAELLAKGENRYRLVVATAKRGRELFAGEEPLIDTYDDVPDSIAADEIEAGKLKIYDEEEWKKINPEFAEKEAAEESQKADNAEPANKVELEDKEENSNNVD